MQFASLCHLGAEKAVLSELEQYGLVGVAHDGFVVFDASIEDASRFAYHTYCSTRILAVMFVGSESEVSLSSDLIPVDSSFAVRVDCIPGSTDEKSSQEFAYEFGSLINRPVNLSNPDFPVFAQVGSTTVIGVDCTGDLSKRYYKIFSSPRSLKGTFISSVLRLFDVSGSVLDPFGSSGDVSVEAALIASHTSALKFSKFEKYPLLDTSVWVDSPKEDVEKIYCFDPQLGVLRSAKKNAKLAGVSQYLTFSKLDPEWMDVKFDEKSLDGIVTLPPPVTQRSPSSTHLEELCYQAEFVLNKKGKLVVICTTPETSAALSEYAQKHRLKFIEECVIFSGKLPVQVVCYGV